MQTLIHMNIDKRLLVKTCPRFREDFGTHPRNNNSILTEITKF